MALESVSSTERQQLILNLLSRQQRLSVTEICKTFTISEATARRDLESLAERGKIQRVHGGAILVEQAPPELPILDREAEQNDEKIRIGATAANLIGNNETIFLGSGTTVLEVARNLRQRQNLTVITNSLLVLNTLTGLSGITTVSLGGVLRPSELSFIGHITEQALAEVRAEKVFIGARAISLEQGLTNDYLPETMTDRAILKAGREIIVVADHSKFNRVSTAFLAPLSSIDKLVTDNQASKDFLADITRQGIEVILA